RSISEVSVAGKPIENRPLPALGLLLLGPSCFGRVAWITEIAVAPRSHGQGQNNADNHVFQLDFSERRMATARLASATASATTISIAATANVNRMPTATDSGCAAAISTAADPRANTAPMTDAPVMSPRLRDRLSMPETTPRWSGRTSTMRPVLLAAWNSW